MAQYINKLINEFEGWSISIDEPILFDPEGNHYHLDEIRSIFFTRQFMNSTRGTLYDRTVITLKEHLESKILAVEAPTVTVDWGDGRQQVITHPKYG